MRTSGSPSGLSIGPDGTRTGSRHRTRSPGAYLVFSLVRGWFSTTEAMDVATGLIDATEATGNPYARSFALLTYGIAFRDADPLRARDALRRALAIAQDSGNRYNESHSVDILGRLEAQYGDPLAALGYLTQAIGNYHDSGNTTVIHVPLAVLAALLHRLGRDDPAATIAGYAFGPVTKGRVPELKEAIAQLRDALGDQAYESRASKGETMTTAAMATYAYDQIDQARTELNAVSK